MSKAAPVSNNSGLHRRKWGWLAIALMFGLIVILVLWVAGQDKNRSTDSPVAGNPAIQIGAAIGPEQSVATGAEVTGSVDIGPLMWSDGGDEIAQKPLENGHAPVIPVEAEPLPEKVVETPGLIMESGTDSQSVSGNTADAESSGSAEEQPKPVPKKVVKKTKKGPPPTDAEMPSRTALIYEASISVPAGISRNQVKSVIIEALKGRTWKPENISSSRINAVLYIRSHTARIRIPYSSKSVRISYRSSNNLKYQNIRGYGIIHKNYNRWVRYLEQDITKKLSTLR